jgi:hypothetical protein
MARAPAGHDGEDKFAYFTGIIVCWYGVPAHMTYGIEVLGSAERG